MAFFSIFKMKARIYNKKRAVGLDSATLDFPLPTSLGSRCGDGIPSAALSELLAASLEQMQLITLVFLLLVGR